MLLQKKEKIKDLFSKKEYNQVEKLVSKLIKKSPANAELYSIRGRALRFQHSYGKAHKDFMHAYKLNTNLSVLKKDAYQSIIDKSFDELLREYSKKDKKSEVSSRIAEILCSADSINSSLSNSKFEQLILETVQSQISHENLRGVVYFAQRLHLKRLNEIGALQKLHSESKEEKEQIIEYFSNDELFHFILNADFNTNLKLELVIRGLRREILLNFDSYRKLDCLDRLLCSISQQMFLNEYIYDKNEDEIEKIIQISNYLLSKSTGEDFDIYQIILLSMYQDISEIPDIVNADFPKQFYQIKKSHIFDKNKESEIVASLCKADVITDETSKSVKEQYEENPYPRWHPNIEKKFKRGPLKKHLEKSFDVKLSNRIFDKPIKRTLIAGCGTGQQIYYLSRFVDDISVDALDLSFRSLAYAKRVISELDIKNVSFLQGDILNVESLYEKKFDYIECGGVLHHMKHPEEGLKRLTNILNDDGVIFLGLYSRKAREKFAPLKDFIKTEMGSYGPDSKYLREMLMTNAVNGNSTALKMFEMSRDIYHTSGYRDLLFHAKEHEYDLVEISNLLAKCGLRFLNMAQGTFRNINRETQVPKTLIEWDGFENKYPDSFYGMYQFVVEKF